METEQTKRSIIKTITWRITASLDTFIIAWVITGDWKMGSTIAGIEVITALSSSATMDFGITGGDVDVFVDGDANATGYSVLTATARPIIASADTIDLLVAGADSSAGKVRVFALLCDVSGVYETANNA